MLAGRLFHAVGPATVKALDPSRVRVLGTSKCYILLVDACVGLNWLLVSFFITR